MLYILLKILTNIFYRIFYKLEFKGLDEIPYGKPIVLAPNHVNGFIDPVIVAMLLKRKVRFFARGDVFKGRVVKWLLEKLNISPMYRIQEGYSELKKNDKTFEECKKLLSENKIVLLFPEAICVQERRLRPLKKGLARIVFQTEESFNFNKDILIIPVGLNYSSAKKFRSKLFIDFGNPVSIKDFADKYQTDKVKAINEFTKVLEQKMAEQLVIIKNKENDELVEGIEEIYTYQLLKEKTPNNKQGKQYQASKEIAAMVNWMEEKNNELLISLKEKVPAYIRQLKRNDLRDHLLRPEAIINMNIGTFILDFLFIYIGTIFYFVGLTLNYLPYYLAKNASIKKVKHKEFFASFYCNMAMFLWLIYFAIQLLIVALCFHSWLLLSVYFLVVILTGIYALRFYPVRQKILGKWRLLRMVRKERTVVEDLLSTRNEIIDELELIRKEYLNHIIKQQ